MGIVPPYFKERRMSKQHTEVPTWVLEEIDEAILTAERSSVESVNLLWKLRARVLELPEEHRRLFGHAAELASGGHDSDG